VLSAAATGSGVLISLGYTSTDVSLTVPSTVTVPGGRDSVNFSVQIAAASSAATVSLSATAQGKSEFLDLNAVPAGITVSVTPLTAVLSSGQTVQFSSTTYSTTNTPVTWSLDPGSGTISASGLYTAPAVLSPKPQEVLVRATSLEDPTKAGAAVVTLASRVSLSSVVVVPGQASATITWVSDLVSDSSVLYGSQASALNQSVASRFHSRVHALTLDRLSSGVPYYFRVVSKTTGTVSGTWPDLSSPPAKFEMTGPPRMISPPPPRSTRRAE
jgi:hypothetical protein